MEEARKELLKIEEIKVQDYTDTVRELTGFIRDSITLLFPTTILLPL